MRVTPTCGIPTPQSNQSNAGIAVAVPCTPSSLTTSVGTPVTTPISLPKKVILVVDDDRDNQQIVGEVLREQFNEQFDVTILDAFNLESALRFFETDRGAIDCVVSDNDMGDLGAGICLYHQIRGNFGFVGPFALVSGRKDPKAINPIAKKDLKFKAFEKPVRLSTLSQWIEPFLTMTR